MKHITQNGWTKELMKAQVRLNNAGVRSEGADGCLYRSLTRDGKPNACAAGCFIPDEQYSNRMEDRPVNYKFFFENIKFPLDLSGMHAFQNAHDTYDGTEDMRDVLCRWIDKNVVNSKRGRK